MRVLAPLIFSMAIGIAMSGTSAADAPACPQNRDCKSKPTTDLKSESAHAMKAGDKDSRGWRQTGIAVDPWIVPTFK